MSDRPETYSYPDRVHQLRRLGLPVRDAFGIWRWDWFKDMEPGCPYLPLLRHVADFYEHGMTAERNRRQVAASCPPSHVSGSDGSVVVALLDDRFVRHDGQASVMRLACKVTEVAYHALARQDYHIADMGQAAHLGCCYAATEDLLAWLDRHLGVDGDSAVLRAAGLEGEKQKAP